MKIKIGPYKDWFGPYQLAEKLCFWAKKEEDEYGFKRNPGWVHDFGEFLAHGSVEPKERTAHKLFDDDRHNTWISKFLSWIDSKKSRTVKIHIDKYDTWGMDSTLALIIVPMLKQLREDTHGHPMDFASPDPNAERQYFFEGEGFEFPDDGHERWQACLDKMIWAFEQVNDDDWEDQYRSGKIEFDCVPCEDSDHWELVKGSGDTSECDYEGMRKHQERMQEGFDLFGKYYRNLWD